MTAMTMAASPLTGRAAFPATEYAIVDGLTHYLDTGILYSGSITYMDGTTATGIPLRVLQDTTAIWCWCRRPRGASALEIDALTTRRSSRSR
jgi:hypothetical protein